jgi:hypothetical protein
MIRADVATLFKEVLGSFGRIQYDDDLPEDMERHDTP